LECWDRGLQAVQEGQASGGVALCVGERSDCTALTVTHDVFESCWVRIRAMENKAGVVVGVCY